MEISRFVAGPVARLRWPAASPFMPRWLFCPTPQAVGFALRNTLASLIALAIALWMELDSPQWAVATVWSVAQVRRGESMSKARWRIVGTLVGAVAAVVFIAAFPQQSWLFFPAVAAWIGLCSFLATFCLNFRSYAFVLSGYTCSIIAVAAASAPDDVFFIGVSRATYIVLGVVCEAAIATLFTLNLSTRARATMVAQVEDVLHRLATLLREIVLHDRDTLVHAGEFSNMLVSVHQGLEFPAIEMGRQVHAGDHARAVLAEVSILVTRLVGLSGGAERAMLSDDGILADTRGQLLHLCDRLATARLKAGALDDLHAQAAHLRTLFEQRAATGTQEMGRITHGVLAAAMGDMEEALAHCHAIYRPPPHDHFRFHLGGHRDIRLAFHNGLRGAVAIMLAALVYEVTAWPGGMGFIAITTLVCGLFATRENPVVGTTRFLSGAVWSAVAAGFLDLGVLPYLSDYEEFAFVLGIFLFVGGLAKCSRGTAGAAAAYGLLMPNLLMPGNQSRVDEVTFLNGAWHTVLAVGLSVLVFRLVLPFRARDERLRFGRHMRGELRRLCLVPLPPSPQWWIGTSVDRIGRMVRHAAQAGDHGAAGDIRLMLMFSSVGLNILLLRQLKRQRRDAVSAVITALLRALVRYRVASPRGIAVVRAARRRLARMERADPGNGRLLEVLACLDGIGRTASACVAAMAAGVE
ncbi:FUSC family protein [Komagataeibacter rhaeticus]|uniref:FUSC family protein n=1 Tax=Komagataeibacter rhaeticus TaxID=215221 RepID=UPI0004DA9716|nr:FUSC family protein [Komagataeibacter rhaeticus]KDU96739.1 fusaric acid resistance protein [Komagataeibacter rhaeticus AF1]MBL7241064.1 FUSC family protein [Komagataeibacter rhaeticus]PYD54365.1 FUSC family protein [Komagataeibacter rhaeticus]GBQ14567.1 fusaric acid resistance protein [Komagataeibacter rhaeticus DSM 16663]